MNSVQIMSHLVTTGERLMEAFRPIISDISSYEVVSSQDLYWMFRAKAMKRR
jgi:hypothetical protein